MFRARLPNASVKSKRAPPRKLKNSGALGIDSETGALLSLRRNPEVCDHALQIRQRIMFGR
jgi:hypothetical protein